jgi:hypothetical protein
MPAPESQVPAYRRRKHSGKAVVTIRRVDHYLGEFDSPESHAKYKRLIVDYLANDGRLEPRANAPLTVSEMIRRYLAYVDEPYVDEDGRPTSELSNIKNALRPLEDLYGDEPGASIVPSDDSP